MLKYIRVAAALAAAGLLGACSGGAALLESQAHVSREFAAPVRPIAVKAPEEKLLACIRNTRVLANVRYGIGGVKDNTKRGNYSAPGSIGGFLPEAEAGGRELNQAFMSMGAITHNYYDTAALRELASLGGPVVIGKIHSTVNAGLPTYFVNGGFSSLDFTGGISADVQVAGIGPTLNTRGADLSLGIEIMQSGSSRTMAIADGTRFIPYVDVGASGGKYINNQLVTGSVSVSAQGSLQYNAIYGSIKVVAAKAVMKAFPKAAEACGKLLDEVHQEYAPSAPTPPATPVGNPVTVAKL